MEKYFTKANIDVIEFHCNAAQTFPHSKENIQLKDFK
jgi:hypothetical protein